MRTLLFFMNAVNISGAVVATLAALALFLGTTSAAKAGHLTAPTGLVCDATAAPTPSTGTMWGTRSNIRSISG